MLVLTLCLMSNDQKLLSMETVMFFCRVTTIPCLKFNCKEVAQCNQLLHSKVIKNGHLAGLHAHGCVYSQSTWRVAEKLSEVLYVTGMMEKSNTLKNIVKIGHIKVVKQALKIMYISVCVHICFSQ